MLFLLSDIELDFNDDDDSPGKENIEGGDNKPKRNQSFVRNDQKRRVICHRRTPSAPTTPKRDFRDVGSSCRDTDEILKQQLSDADKSASQPVLQGALSAKPPRNDRAKTSQKKLFESDNSVAGSPKLRNVSSEEVVSEKRKGSKTPPKDRKKLKDERSCVGFSDSSEFHDVQKNRTRDDSDDEDFSDVQKDPMIKELCESPGSRRKVWGHSASVPDESSLNSKGIHHFYSRVHDYAEIDDKDLDPTITESHNPRAYLKSDSKTEQQIEKPKAVPQQDTQMRRYPVESIDNLTDISDLGPERQSVYNRVRTDSTTDSSGKPKLLETNFFIDNKQPVVVHSVPADHSSRTSSASDSATNSASSSQQYLPHEDLLSEISKFEKGLETIQQYPYKKSMAKCLSIPSDIQKSLENISNGSDILSSVTISELSQSQDNVFVSESDTLTRRRRSTSLDGLSDESPMSRTLKEINAQIDRAFKQDRHKARSLHNLQGKLENFPKDNTSDITSQLISYDNELLESPPRQRTFGSVRESDMKSPVERTCSAPVSHDKDKSQSELSSNQNNKFVDRPVAETHIVETPQVVRAPLRPSKQDGKSSLSTTPTRPVPPDSLDIISPGLPVQPRIPASQSDTHIAQNVPSTQSKKSSPTLPPRPSGVNSITSQSKTGFRMSEEDFQKALLSEDPDSLKHFQQSMMYSPVRSHRRGVLDGERSNRSSLASPDACGQKVILSKSGVVSPDTSPRQTHSKVSQSPDSSPVSHSKPPHPKISQSPDSSPGSYSRHSKVLPSPDASPGSFSRQSHSKILQNPDASPNSYKRQQHAKISSSPKSENRHHQSKLPVPQSPKTVPQSPKSESSHQQPKVSQSLRSENRTYRCPQTDKHNYPSPPADKKTKGSPVVEKKGPSPKTEKKSQNRSAVQSPMSPEHMQPRWEDLAGLNDSFSDIDLAMFNEDWKNQLAPTGDSIRQSSNTPQLNDRWSSQSEIFPESEVSTDTNTVVVERPSIKRKNIPENVSASSSEANVSEIEYYDNVPEHESLMPETRNGATQQDTRNETKTVTTERPVIQRSYTVPPSDPPQPHTNRFGFASRAVLERANTVPVSPAMPLSPTRRIGLDSVLEHSNSFESVSGLTKQVSFDTGIGVNSAFTSVEKSAVRKSSTTPSLTRQTSFDSSSYGSVRVTSLGSSFEELDNNVQNQVHVIHSGQSGLVTVQQQSGSVSSHSLTQSNQPIGTFITMTASDRNPITVSAAGNIEPSGFSLLIRSDSSQSSDVSFPEIPHGGRNFRNFNISSNFSDNLPRMLEEIDPNESCLGLATHQNMSNEMKEMMQEQMKECSGVISPLQEIMNPLLSLTSPFSLQSRTFYDASHPLEGHDMESSIEVPSDVQSVHLPREDLQVLSEGPVVIASPNVLTQLNSDSLPRHQHVPIDNSEEEYQNAVNADLERNLASLNEYLPHHVTVCEPQDQFRDVREPENRTFFEEILDTGGTLNTLGIHAPGLEHLTLISPSAFTIKDTPDPVTRDSDSTSSSSLSSSMVSSTNSIIQTPSGQSDWTYRQSVFRPVFLENLNVKGDLAAPPLEMIEICKSVITKPKTRQVNAEISEPENKDKSPVGKSITLTFDFPSSNRDLVTAASSSESQNSASAERGETKLIIDRRPSLKKKTDKPKNETVSKVMGQPVESAGSDHGEQSGSEDDVFIDPSEVTPNTTFYGAKSKYFQRRDFLSQGNFPLNFYGVPSSQSTELKGEEVHKPWYEPQSRFSVDESMLQMASNRHEDLFTKHMGLDSTYNEDLAGMDIGHEDSEDIRFSKAHRSSKLMSLCEMFEKGSATSLNSEGEEGAREKTVTPPEKNIVSSIKQMHESLEMDKEENEVFNKPKRVKKISLNESGSSNDSFNTSKDDSFESKEKTKQCLSPTYTSVKEGNFLFEAPGSSEAYRVGRPYSKSSEIMKENAEPGKPPKYRSNSRTRTPSESSLGETEGSKANQKFSQMDSSPKSSRYTGSPKGSRYSQISSEEDGSPRTARPGGSPKVQDKKIDSSPKPGRPKEGPPVAPRQSPKMSKSVDSGSKIPVRNGSPKGPNGSPKGSKYGEKGHQSPRHSSSPKSSQNGRSTVKTETSPKIRQRQDSSERAEKEVQKRSITKRGESIEERYHLNFEPVGKTKGKESLSSSGEDGAKRKGEEKKRRGSIKELMNLFEEKTGGKMTEGGPGDSPDQSPPQIKLRTRVRSVSPSAPAPRSPPRMPVNVRHSVELPVRGTLSHSEGVFKISEGIYRPQQVRLGPKPFYGAK